MSRFLSISALSALAVLGAAAALTATPETVTDACCAHEDEAPADDRQGAPEDEPCPGPCTSCDCCLHAPAAPVSVAATPRVGFVRVRFEIPAAAAPPDGVAFAIDRPPRG